MDLKQAITFNLSSSQFLVDGYLADLTDAELMVRPVPGANHIAWQLGHLIAAERYLADKAAPGKMQPLPEGFVERHKKDKAASDIPADFFSKAEYSQLAQRVRADTKAAVDSLPMVDFDNPASGGPPFIKTVGDVFLFISGHWLIHAGQWAVVRRKIGRAPLF